MSLLEVRGLERSFYGIHALRGVDLDVEAGRITGLLGPNGAGKTTLFNCISGLYPPTRGQIRLDGQDIAGWRPDRITHFGLVRTFQIARVFSRLSVLENLMLYGPDQPGERVTGALSRSRAAGRRESELLDQAVVIAEKLNLTAVLTKTAAALSGGQKKLLEIGRALMTRPRLILLDEPVAGVNPTLAREIGEHLKTLVREGITILLIEHHLDTISRLCDHVIVLAEGRRLAEGSFEAVASDPAVQEAYMGRGVARRGDREAGAWAS